VDLQSVDCEALRSEQGQRQPRRLELRPVCLPKKKKGTEFANDLKIYLRPFLKICRCRKKEKKRKPRRVGTLPIPHKYVAFDRKLELRASSHVI